MNTTSYLSFQRTGKMFPLLAALSLGLTSAAFGQLQWSSYNSSGALVTANVAAGGDATYGGSASLTVPAGTQLIFLTKSFAPVNLTNASAFQKINFSLGASGGMNSGTLGRIYGLGLFNDSGTPASAADDAGYWCNFNTGNPGFEMFYRPSGNSTYFQYDSSHKLGTGAVKTGNSANNVIYGMQFQLNMNASASGISIGTSSSTFAAAGAAMTNGNGSVFQTAYTSVNPLSTLAVSNFNEFAFMFKNTTTSNVTVTLNGLNLVPLNPGISTNPADFNGSPGGAASFTVALNTNSATPLGYQWYEIAGGVTNALTDGLTANGSTVSGSATNMLTFSNAQIADSGYVFVVITNAYGSGTSVPALLNIANASAPVFISLSLTNATVNTGGGTNVSVRASGVPAPVYYWFDNHTNLLQSGASQTLTLANLQFANGGTYSVVASNSLGTVTTNFTINVYVPPCLTQEPGNVLVNVGDPVNFYVAEGGCAVPAPAYQWYKNGSPISGATATNYSIASVVLTNIGSYYVVVSNPAGAVPSTSAKLAIYSANLTGSPTWPANNATGLCVDTYLKFTLNQTPTVGNTGKIYIYDTTNSATPVDVLDLSLNSSRGVQPHSPFAGDNQAFNYYPVVLAGNTATIYPHSGVLSTNQTYYVTMDPGVFVDASGAYFAGLNSPSAWQFTTKPAGPANPTNLVVAADNSGDFLTVQGAVDSLPLNNTSYTLINILNGNYFEIVNISDKNHVTFRGQSRTGTVVGYPNNANIAPGGTTHARMAFKVNANDIALENLTISNSTPQGGSQAEALMIESGAARCIVNNAEVDSRQDTILANVNTSQAYFYNSLVQGNYDYIWGGGNLFFTNCELRIITGVTTPNLVAPRTDNGVTGNWPGYSGLLVSNGFSFVSCQLTRQTSGVTNCSMSDANGSLNGLAAWINCSIDTGGYTNALVAAQTSQLLWEYGCSNLNNTVQLTNTAGPFIGFTQLNNGDPRLLAAQNATTWLNGWQPQLAPNILTNPASQTVTATGNATFAVVATGIPDPAYQWLLNSTNLPGATAATLTLTNTQAGDAGAYSVVVTTPAGSVTSSAATLTVNPLPTTAPVFTAPTDGASYAINVGVNFAVSCTATNLAYPAQTFTFALLGGPVAAAINATNGSFTWRPGVAQANSTNPVVVTVTGNGLPNLVATNHFTVTVNPLTPPAVGSAAYAGGHFSLTVSGQTGPDYIVQVSTNLTAGWTPLFTNRSPAMPFTFTDPNGGLPLAFYRILVGP